MGLQPATPYRGVMGGSARSGRSAAAEEFHEGTADSEEFKRWRARAGLLHVPARWSMAIVATVIIAMELPHLLGVHVPAPFMAVYVSVAFAATFSGLRAGLWSALFASLFVLYRWFTAPEAAITTSTPAAVVLALALGFLLAGVLGVIHDLRGKLLRALALRERELVAARRELAGLLEQKSAALDETRTALRQARFELEQAMSNAPIGIIALASDRSLQFINAAALRGLGLSEAPTGPARWRSILARLELRDRSGRRLTVPAEPVTEALRAGVATTDFECRLRGLDGVTRWFSGYVGPILTPQKHVNGAVIMLVETTRQKDTTRALQRLTRLLFRVQEDQRSEIARELHEEIGQSLAALKFSLHAETDDAAPDSLARIDHLTEAIRQLSLELHPQALDDFGLATAVKTLLGERQTLSGVPCRLDADQGLVDLPDECAIAAYRTIEEAVNNALAHADPSRIEVRLAADGEDLRVEVQNDGRAFDVDTAEIRAAADGRLGLLFMRERVKQLDGELSIVSSADSGTRVTARLPRHSGGAHAQNQAGAD